MKLNTTGKKMIPCQAPPTTMAKNIFEEGLEGVMLSEPHNDNSQKCCESSRNEFTANVLK